MNGTDITKARGFAALTVDQQKTHLAKVGLRARAILGGFWENTESDAVRAMEVEAWVAVLGKLSHDEIRAAWAEYQRTGPRTHAGRLYRPDAGALYRIVMAELKKARERAATEAEAARFVDHETPEDLR